MQAWKCQTCGMKFTEDPTLTGCPSCRQFQFVAAEEIDATGTGDTVIITDSEPAKRYEPDPPAKPFERDPSRQ